MTLVERLKNFEDRGFRAETAAVLVLIEEAVHCLFITFTDTFVLFGGATLVLFYGSQRHSGDIDLLLQL
jgi:Nucleotidyl transferase AbiEii toxin, Type IV TA system